MAKKSLAEMVASQRKANQVKHGPINTFGQNATDIAYPEDSATQKMLQTVATPDQTKVTPDAEVNLDAPAIDETPPIDNTTKAVAPTAKPEDDEDAIITHAMKTLGDRLREAAPHVDFTEEYKKLLEENKRPERKGLSPLKAFAISLGGGPAAVQQASQTQEKANDEADSRWREMMTIREQALRGDIQQKLDQGKFKQALAQSEELARMNSALERAKGAREHGYKMEEIGKQNEGKINVANINADKAKAALNTKLQSLASVYKLEGDIKKEFFKQMFRAMATRATAQDITGQPVVSSDDFAGVLEDAMDWAEKHSGINFSEPVPHPAALGGNGKTPPKNETPEQKALREIRESKKH